MDSGQVAGAAIAEQACLHSNQTRYGSIPAMAPASSQQDDDGSRRTNAPAAAAAASSPPLQKEEEAEAEAAPPLPLALLLQDNHRRRLPFSTLHPPPILENTFEIQAVRLSYKSPRSSSFARICRNLLPIHYVYPHSSSSHDRNPLILNNISFLANSAEILAIVGPSGAGKSTLLEILAGKIRPSSPPGSLLVNRSPMHVPSFRRISGFIPQSDALFPLLTVRETLLFSAHLRLPRGVSPAEKERRVAELLSELRLEHVAGCRIGSGDGGKRGISGGERRRVSIGVDVIHDPAVLILDEPTSGLDSAAALNVVEMLHAMAKTRSRTIILSIHQPGYKILQLIHSFLLLSRGTVIHHGSLASMQYQLTAAGHNIPPHANVLEYAIEIIATSTPNMGLSSTQLHGIWTEVGGDANHGGGKKRQHSSPAAAIFRHHHHHHQSARRLHHGHHQIMMMAPKTGGSSVAPSSVAPLLRLSVALEMEAKEEEEEVKREYDDDGGVDQTYYYGAPAFACGHVKEVMILSQRFARNVFRTHELFTARSMQAISVGITLGTLYMKLPDNDRGAAERLGFFAFTLTFLLSSTVEALPIFLQERQVFVRETSRGAYRISSYLTANFAVFLPFLLLLSLLFSGPVYWLVGLNPAPEAFAFFVLIIWLVLLTANSFVAFFGALVPDYIMGNSIISGFMGAFFLFSGYFISKQDMPPYWRFMHYVSLFKYPLDGLLINEYSTGGAERRCFAPFPPPAAAALEGTAACSFTAQDELRRLGLDGISKWCTVLMMLTFAFFYRFLCYVVLRFKVCRR